MKDVLQKSKKWHKTTNFAVTPTSVLLYNTTLAHTTPTPSCILIRWTTIYPWTQRVKEKPWSYIRNKYYTLQHAHNKTQKMVYNAVHTPLFDGSDVHTHNVWFVLKQWISFGWIPFLNPTKTHNDLNGNQLPSLRKKTETLHESCMR